MNPLAEHQPNKYLEKKIYSPFKQEDQYSQMEKTGITKFTLKNNHSKYLVDNHPEEVSQRQTQRKKYEPKDKIDILHEKIKVLTSQNAELYRLLDQRGRIIVALQKKIEKEAVQEANLNTKKDKYEEHQLKLKVVSYQNTIQQLRKELSSLKSRVFYQNEASSLNHSFLNQQLRDDLTKLHNQLIDAHNRSKFDLNQQKNVYEHRLDALTRQHIHELEVLTMEHSLELEQLKSLLDLKVNQIEKMKQIKEKDKKQLDFHNDILSDNNKKLQQQIEFLDKTHKEKIKEEMFRVQQLHINEVKSLIRGNEERVNDLEAEIEKQESLIESKTEEIKQLLKEIHLLKVHSEEKEIFHDDVVKKLKEELMKIELNHSQILKREKIIFQELKQTDISAVKQFYQHQIQMLNFNLHEQIELYQKIKNSLYQELDQKEEMRKKFDFEITSLSKRMRQLQNQNKQIIFSKSSEIENLNNKIKQIQKQSQKQLKKNESLSSTHDEVIQNFQKLITTKDTEIDDLNKKIKLLKQNFANEINQKDNTLLLLKKAKEEFEAAAKKQKYVLENEIKKKQMTIRNNKDILQAEVKRLKGNHQAQYQEIVKKIEEEKQKANLQIYQLKNIEKHLRYELQITKSTKQNQQRSQNTDLKSQNKRLLEQKNQLEQQLTFYYTSQLTKLKKQIEELKKKVAYKEDDVRNTNEKYYRLQQKMSMVLQGQQKLKNIENKLMTFESEQSLIKNFAEVMKKNKQ